VGAPLCRAPGGGMAAAVPPHPPEPHPRCTAPPPGAGAAACLAALVGRVCAAGRGSRAAACRSGTRTGARDRKPPGAAATGAGAAAAAGPAARGLPAAQPRGPGRCGDRAGHGLFRGQREDASFPGAAGAALATGRPDPMNDPRHDDFERRVTELLATSTDALDGGTRAALLRARRRAVASAAPRTGPAWRYFAPVGVAAAVLLAFVLFMQPQLS